MTLASPQGITWPARVTRIASGMDPVTRTMRVVVTVDEPYRKAQPPERPPLQPGMYARVRLTVESPEPDWWCPRAQCTTVRSIGWTTTTVCNAGPSTSPSNRTISP
ncbi:MAG: hypothetical protein U5L11_17455 [Arhodomonas sp.]|nr:hypothetical protein [Arhodomonas sp.]